MSADRLGVGLRRYAVEFDKAPEDRCEIEDGDVAYLLREAAARIAEADERPAWMGRYPRKGADWSPEEDRALLRAYESGRYLTKQIAARHLREPIAIERRLGMLRDRKRLEAVKFGGARGGKTWQQEQEAARKAMVSLRDMFPEMWSKEEADFRATFQPRELKPGDIIRAGRCYIGVHHPRGVAFVPLTKLPPEVAQALQFGEGGES